MKKLLYTFLAVSVIFSACEKEVEEPVNNNNSNNNSALSIGDTLQGGIIFYLDGNGGGLVAAPTDHNTVVQWGCYETLISGADGLAIGTGAQNTIDIVNEGCGEAADICANLTLGGYSDWFLPSIDELNIMYLNIGGSNNEYWSSSVYNANTAWIQNFIYGSQYNDSKYYYANVRAVRAF